MHLGCLAQMDGSSIVLKVFAVDNRHGLGEVDSLIFHFLEEIHHNDHNAEALQRDCHAHSWWWIEPLQFATWRPR
jgi:hypothetical protein